MTPFTPTSKTPAKRNLRRKRAYPQRGYVFRFVLQFAIPFFCSNSNASIIVVDSRGIHLARDDGKDTRLIIRESHDVRSIIASADERYLYWITNDPNLLRRAELRPPFSTETVFNFGDDKPIDLSIDATTNDLFTALMQFVHSDTGGRSQRVEFSVLRITHDGAELGSVFRSSIPVAAVATDAINRRLYLAYLNNQGQNSIGSSNYDGSDFRELSANIGDAKRLAINRTGTRLYCLGESFLGMPPVQFESVIKCYDVERDPSAHARIILKNDIQIPGEHVRAFALDDQENRILWAIGRQPIASKVTSYGTRSVIQSAQPDGTSPSDLILGGQNISGVLPLRTKFTDIQGEVSNLGPMLAYGIGVICVFSIVIIIVGRYKSFAHITGASRIRRLLIALKITWTRCVFAALLILLILWPLSVLFLFKMQTRPITIGCSMGCVFGNMSFDSAVWEGRNLDHEGGPFFTCLSLDVGNWKPKAKVSPVGMIAQRFGIVFPSQIWQPESKNISIRVPFWIPVIAGLLLLFYRHIRSRRACMHPCPKCGYDLFGNITGRCPECGEPIPPVKMEGIRSTTAALATTDCDKARVPGENSQSRPKKL